MTIGIIGTALVEDEFGRSLVELGASLRALVRRLTGSAVDGDDLLQDTLLRCWAARASFEPGTSMLAWARTVMRNSFLSSRRRARFQAELPDDAVDRLLWVPENQSAIVDLRDVNRALDELNPDQREAIVTASLGITVEEAAARLAIEPGTYKSRLWRGRERLRRLVEQRETPRLSDRRAPEPTVPKPPPRRKRRSWKGVMIG